MKSAGLFAALLGLVIGMLVPGRDAIGVYILALGCAACARYCLDWSELKAERRQISEPVMRERRRRDYEIGR
jgi:hypothetical protein